MLKIRLQRIGKKGQAYFRVVVLEHTKKPKGEFLELLGTYDPHKKVLNAKKERIDYWLSNGAGISPTVNNLLVNYKYLDREKVVSWKPKKKEKPAESPAPVPAPKTEASPASAETSSESPAPETSPAESAPESK